MTVLVKDSLPSAASACTKRRAARMGPTVCALDGPRPMVKRSRALRYILASLLRRPAVRRQLEAQVIGIGQDFHLRVDRRTPLHRLPPLRIEQLGMVRREGLAEAGIG